MPVRPGRSGVGRTADREMLTVRLAPPLADAARRAAARQGRSLNDFVTLAIDRAVAAADPEMAAEARAALRGRIAQEAGGPLPPSAALFRALREGDGRHAADGDGLPRQQRPVQADRPRG